MFVRAPMASLSLSSVCVGYAKVPNLLAAFVNECAEPSLAPRDFDGFCAEAGRGLGLPLEPIYTGKMFAGIAAAIQVRDPRVLPAVDFRCLHCDTLHIGRAIGRAACGGGTHGWTASPSRVSAASSACSDS